MSGHKRARLHCVAQESAGAASTLGRRGFTLIELLVVMALIVSVAAVALMVVPAALERDRTVDAVNQIQNMLQIAQARAMRDGRPHGVRLILDSTQPNLLFATSLQYIEVPPLLLPNPDPTLLPSAPYIRFLYSYDNSGAIVNRRCQLVNVPTALLTFSPQQRLLLVLPVLGTWNDIISVTPVGSNVLELGLRHYPDEVLGAAGLPSGTAATDVEIYRTYHFGILRAPQPLLGEPIVRLPSRTCIDLSPGLSIPDASSLPAGTDYDLIFIPSGQLSPYGANRGAGHVFLWVRDPNKPEGSGQMAPGNYGGVTTPAFLDALRRGGEQMIVAIKASSGAIGAAPVYWPDSTSTDLHKFAREAIQNQ
ncbi:prepilin-type N-terminal cleavage/methylation domain-containing protein [Thermogemmata fonticola]|uniref:prepilin-type N-terminal cleavage/methylation domain-containing protein n=1 Tax=Thermogemmata fonticola TaxID=2755323 RepID=UPI001E2C18DC|nr:prepilin-type N-terminal cleavage/methylation domain-containing protein [Thermogemmata fonticola]